MLYINGGWCPSYTVLQMLTAVTASPAVDDSGRVTKYPVWWVAKMRKDSKAFEQLLRVRVLYPRIKRVLGDQWICEVMGSDDYGFYHNALDMAISSWETEDQQRLRESGKELDLQEMHDQMYSILDGFDPLWEHNGDWVDDKPTIYNARPYTERVSNMLEVESMKRDLEAFRVSAGLQEDDSVRMRAAPVPPSVVCLEPVPSDGCLDEQLVRALQTVKASVEQALPRHDTRKRRRSAD